MQMRGSGAVFEDRVQVEFDDCVETGLRGKPVCIAPVVLKEIFSEYGGTKGVSKDIEIRFFVRVTIGIVCANKFLRVFFREMWREHGSCRSVKSVGKSVGFGFTF